MIIAKIDEDRFVELVRSSPLIAFQELEFGYAVAGPGEAFYAPIDHPGGGNLMEAKGTFLNSLGRAFIARMSRPAYRTLRPTAKPIPTAYLLEILRAHYGAAPEPMQHFDKLSGDHIAVVESECQIVILAIEENERPDLKDAMGHLKRDMMSDALDLVIEHAESARELCEVGEDKPALIKMHLLQTSTALQTALEMLLRP